MSDEFRDLLEADEQGEFDSWGPQQPDKVEAQSRIDYLMQILVERQQRIDEKAAISVARHNQIDDWYQGETAKDLRTIDYLNDQIRQLVPPDVTAFQALYGKKSLSLPYGKVGYQSGRESVNVTDEAVALSWCVENGVEYTTKESVVKKALKAAVETLGLAPEGFEIVQGETKFFVKGVTG